MAVAAIIASSVIMSDLLRTGPAHFDAPAAFDDPLTAPAVRMVRCTCASIFPLFHCKGVYNSPQSDSALSGCALSVEPSAGALGKLVGDRGYLSQALFEQLFARGLQFNTPIRKNMQKRLVVLEDKLLTRKRFVIGTIVDQRKNTSQIEHSRHRSTTNFSASLIAGLIAYSWQAKKPSLNLPDTDMALLPALI